MLERMTKEKNWVGKPRQLWNANNKGYKMQIVFRDKETTAEWEEVENYSKLILRLITKR